MELRNFRWDDLPQIVDLNNRFAQAMGSDTVTTYEEVEKRWRAPHNHPERDCFVAILPNQDFIGYTIADLLDTPHQANGMYCVLPHYPEVADQLIEATEKHFVYMAQTNGASEAMMTYMLSSQAQDGITVLEKRGYVYARQFYVMEAKLDTPLTIGDTPEKLILRPFNPDQDARATYEAELDAFKDHWNFYVPPFEEWLYDIQQPDFDPQHWWLALDGDEIVGLVLSEAANADTAWVGIVGVHANWRRKGLGLALLRQCFAIHQAQGRKQIRLGVDVDNRYQASAVYERAGMSVRSRTLYYQKELMGTKEPS